MSRLHDKLHRRAVATAAAILSAVFAAEAQEAPRDAQSDREPLEEIVVTAQKREQVLKDIPMSITVLSGEFLERQRAHNFQDLVGLVPGFSMETSTRGVSRITLRGVNTGGVASTVGVYVDDVPFGSSSGLANGAILSGDFDTFDLARVEVLRGPQGTLYGASSLGGVLRYVTNQPQTDAFEASGRASVENVEGGDAGYAFTGFANVPVNDRFAIRASGFYRSDDGFIDSIGNNPLPSLTDPDNNVVDGTIVEDGINALETFGGRVSALMQATDNLSLRLTALMQNIESEGADTFEADPATGDPLYGGLVASLYHPEFTDIEYRVFSAGLNWDFGRASFESVTSYGTFEQDFQRDFAFAFAPTITFLFGDPATRPLSTILTQITSTDKFTQEFRLLSSDNEAFEWLIGVYYTEEESGIDPQLILPVEAGTETVAEDLPLLVRASLVSEYEELAFFANATWHITDRFELSFGGRASDNEQVATQVLDGVLAGGLTNFDDARSSENPFTYSVSPRFEVSDNASIYARVATGFRAGGPNVLPPGSPPGTPTFYESDTLTSYEIGIKAGTSGGGFAIDAAAYYLDWEDIQLFAFVNDVGINVNGGTAVSRGFEFTAAVRPAEGLTLSLNGAYTDAYLTQDTDPIVGGLDGDPLSYVPELSLSMNGDYEWPIFGDSLAYVGGDVAYAGERPAAFDVRTPGGNIRETDSYVTLGLRAGIDAGRWNAEVYGKNLTDERGVNSILSEDNFPNDALGLSIIRPRTVGLALGFEF
jgi:outer membrane receptor protein involved in Fe transport